MELIVAEKPKVTQKIAMAIGGRVTRKAKGNVSYYEIEMDGKEIIVAPAVGHIYTLAESKKSRGYPVFDIEWVPSYKASKGAAFTKPYLSLLEELGKKADRFVSACDYDIEGTLISYNIFRFATKIKEGKRMKFSALTDKDLKEAYENRSDFDYNNAYAGEARHILDWYYGINLSRALMGSLRKAHHAKIMSIGRVQGPALNILATLEKEIRAFVPVPYWVLTAEMKEAQFTHKKDKFMDEKEADGSLERTAGSGKVTRMEKREGKIWPGPCFDLTSLQVEAHRTFGFNPSRTLEVSQSLYEDSLITYPRTSSQQIPPSIYLPGIIEKLKENGEYADIAAKIIGNRWFSIFQGKKTDPAHPAIHPTGMKPREKLGKDEERLYDLIVRRFLAAFAPPAERENTTIEVDAGGEPYVAKGGRITKEGWTEFYGRYFKFADKELPEFKEGEEVGVKKKRKTKKDTQPPKRYTQASIVSELEKRHLGTKATRSVVVDTLFKRGYATGKPIEVTDFGLKVRDVLNKYAPEILDDELTRKIEDDMEKIQEGKIGEQEVTEEGKGMLVRILEKWKKNEENIGKEIGVGLEVTEAKESAIGKCDKCGGNLRIIRLKAGRQFIGCSGYPDCRNAYPLPTGAFVKTTEKACPVCGKAVVFVARERMRFEMCIDPNCPSKDKWKKRSEEKKKEDTEKTAEKTEKTG
ncbi:DNA topoisomerase I [Candidatus Micrarchaeota archaeon]|nr:DNA topoisomerase I [Candidatus Micrarchaeota archaeon]